MQYTIDWMEKKQVAGKNIYRATLKDISGRIEEDITIWQDFPGFADLSPGARIEGDVVSKQNGKYVNKSLYPPRNAKPGASTFSPRPSGAVSAAKITSESVKQSQMKKESSIAYFNAINSAIALMEARKLTDDDEVLKDFIIYWRDWFLSEWRKYDALPHEDKHEAF